MVAARNVERAFSPLDEELGLVSGRLTPRLSESVVRMGTWMPFGRAASELEHLLGVEVSESRVRRISERAGASYVAVQEEEVGRLERELPPAPAGPQLQLLSVDGAMVPLVGKQWTEVKTLAVGDVRQETNRQGERVIRTQSLSYFSRCSEASIFARQALAETHRRGVENAKKVSAVTDGAEWAQGFIDYHRADAIRILYFPHSAEHLAQAGRASFGEQSEQFPVWLDKQRHELRHGSSGQVLRDLSRLKAKDEASREMIRQQVEYFEKRREMIRYAAQNFDAHPSQRQCFRLHKRMGESFMEIETLFPAASVGGFGDHFPNLNLNRFGYQVGDSGAKRLDVSGFGVLIQPGQTGPVFVENKPG